MNPGRNCPLHYRYAPADLMRAAPIEAECLYVVGGLYGNLPALDKILELARREPESARIVFNGDFNWFNIDPAGMADVNQSVLEHLALRGNVETELAARDNAAGCGCGYPEFVVDAEVERSNRIMELLRGTAGGFPALRRRLGALPMHATARVGAARVAIVHGDCESLAGWGLSQERLAIAEQRMRVRGWFAQAGVDVIASSHSCLPAMVDFATPRGVCVAVNNGAAGMPNFRNTRHGVITRIATRPAVNPQPLYATRVNDLHVEALPVHYDHDRWQREFLANWPPGSPAYLSYHTRITRGPAYAPAQALRLSATPAIGRRPIAIRDRRDFG